MGFHVELIGSLDITPPLNKESMEKFWTHRKKYGHLNFDYSEDFDWYNPDTDELKEIKENGKNTNYWDDAYQQMVITKDGKKIEWEDGDKFYGYRSCLKALVDFVLSCGSTVNGTIEYTSDNGHPEGQGKLVVVNGEITNYCDLVVVPVLLLPQRQNNQYVAHQPTTAVLVRDPRKENKVVAAYKTRASACEDLNVVSVRENISKKRKLQRTFVVEECTQDVYESTRVTDVVYQAFKSELAKKQRKNS